MHSYAHISDVPFVSVEESESLILGIREDGILHLYMKAHTVLRVTEAKEAIKLIAKMGGGKAFPNLIDPQEGSVIDKSARIFSISPEANLYTLADAILVKNMAHRVLGNAYINFSKPSKPTKLFTKSSDAVNWLKSFLRH